MPQVPITVTHAPERRRPSRRPRASRLSTEPLRQPAGHAGCPGPFHQVRDGRSYRQWEAQARSPRSGPTGGYSLGAFFSDVPRHQHRKRPHGRMARRTGSALPHTTSRPLLPRAAHQHFLGRVPPSQVKRDAWTPKMQSAKARNVHHSAAQARTVHDLLFPLLPARQPLPPRCGRRCCPRRPQGCP